MKRIIKAFTLTLAICSLVLGCNKSSEGSLGSIVFKLSQDEALTEITKSSVGSYTSLPSADNFSIVVTDSNDEQIEIKDPKAQTSLPAGSYSAKAFYGSTSDEGFDKPCFEGTQAFSVTGGQSSSVTIKTKLANALVKFEYTENFKKYYTDYSFTLTTGKGTAISFPASETRAAFIDAYVMTVKGSLTTQGGSTLSFPEKEYKGLEAATCYTLKFDASNVGGTTVSISFNDTVEEVALGEIDLND